MPRINKDGTIDRRGAPKGHKRSTLKYHRSQYSKVCTECKKSKPLTQFHVLKKYKGGKKLQVRDPKRYVTQCKQCKKAVPAKMPRAPRKKGRNFDQAAQKQRIRVETRIKLFDYLAEKGCCDCGCRDPRVLEFDHIDPAQKKHTVSRLIIDGYSWAARTLREEILKCRVICANCHRLHTMQQRDYYKNPDVAKRLREILDEHGIS